MKPKSIGIAPPTRMDAMILNEEGSRDPRQVRRARKCWGAAGA